MSQEHQRIPDDVSKIVDEPTRLYQAQGDKTIRVDIEKCLRKYC